MDLLAAAFDAEHEGPAVRFGHRREEERGEHAAEGDLHFRVRGTELARAPSPPVAVHQGTAYVLTNAGVTATGPNRVKNGDEITVTFNPALNGATIGFLRSIVLQDKKEVEFVPN